MVLAIVLVYLCRGSEWAWWGGSEWAWWGGAGQGWWGRALAGVAHGAWWGRVWAETSCTAMYALLIARLAEYSLGNGKSEQQDREKRDAISVYVPVGVNSKRCQLIKYPGPLYICWHPTDVLGRSTDLSPDLPHVGDVTSTAGQPQSKVNAISTAD